MIMICRQQKPRKQYAYRCEQCGYKGMAKARGRKYCTIGCKDLARGQAQKDAELGRLIRRMNPDMQLMYNDQNEDGTSLAWEVYQCSWGSVPMFMGSDTTPEGALRIALDRK